MAPGVFDRCFLFYRSRGLRSCSAISAAVSARLSALPWASRLRQVLLGIGSGCPMGNVARCQCCLPTCFKRSLAAIIWSSKRDLSSVPKRSRCSSTSATVRYTPFRFGGITRARDCCSNSSACCGRQLCSPCGPRHTAGPPGHQRG